MTCSTAVASYLATSLRNKECAAQSLVKALDTFLQEVQQMRDVVMVPNRLRGVPMPKVVQKTDNGLRRLAESTAMLPLGSRALLPYGVNGFIATEGYLRRDPPESPPRQQQQNQEQQPFAWPEDLFRRYRVVQALRKELLIDGKSSISEDDENDDEQTRILAARFRHYLSGLFEILDQLTGMAKHVSQWYQEEVDVNAGKL